MNATICILLVLCCQVSSQAVKTKCTNPVIKAIEPSLNIYRITDLIDVQVYHCHYLQEVTYSLCKDDIPQVKDTTVLRNTYDDFTQSCISAFERKRYVDKYGYYYNLLKNPYNVSTPYRCAKPDGRQLVLKNKSITLNSYTAKADLVGDRITLRSGTSCKYSSSFCFDPKESIDVTWNVFNQNSKPFCSNHFLKVPFNTASTYYLTVEQKYLIFEKVNEFMALELQKYSEIECGASIWKTNLPGIIVSDGAIAQASNFDRPLEKEDYDMFHFTKKERLYEFLIRKCNTSLSKYSNRDLAYEMLKKEVAIGKAVAETQANTMQLKELKEEFEIFRNRLIFVLCIVGAAELCIAIILVTFVCKIPRKFSVGQDTENDGYKNFINIQQDRDFATNKFKIDEENRSSNIYDNVTGY